MFFFFCFARHDYSSRWLLVERNRGLVSERRRKKNILNAYAFRDGDSSKNLKNYVRAERVRFSTKRRRHGKRAARRGSTRRRENEEIIKAAIFDDYRGKQYNVISQTHTGSAAVVVVIVVYTQDDGVRMYVCFMRVQGDSKLVFSVYFQTKNTKNTKDFRGNIRETFRESLSLSVCCRSPAVIGIRNFPPKTTHFNTRRLPFHHNINTSCDFSLSLSLCTYRF